MAAKQGLTAHLSQASEDARRAVLSRAPPSVRSHSWLSNLNTTCTIKSAPPRTPEVMSMLSTKSGWLIKRNEQNVWQRRWCCVVPHSFLYYFEADPIEAAARDALANGMEYPLSPIGEGGELGGGGNGGGSGGGGVFGNGVDASFQSHKSGKLKNGTKENYTNIQPVGIIDLECYTTVDRGSMDDLVLELTGDSITNPDLRSFYFQGESPDDCEQWTKAFLSDRHSALRDEREAYKQICENFPLQLMHCSDMMDKAEEAQKAAEKKAYHIRSAAEESRKKVIDMVREALEQNRGEDGINQYYQQEGEMDLDQRRIAYSTKLDSWTTGAEAVRMNAGVSESVEILAEYTEILRMERAEFGRDLRDMHDRVKDLGHSMISKTEMEEMQTRLERAMETNQLDRTRLTERITNLEKLLKKERQERADAERTLEAKNMEFTMLSAASKQKIQELSGHKKILKKEVIELRKKVEDISSDATVYKHKTDGLDIQIKAEQERNKVLERHLQHVTDQIKMQERVMDCMMSQAGSVYGGDSRAGDLNSVGGNSSYRGDTGSRTGRYPPVRSDNSRRSGYDLPRFPVASPRNVPPEITSKQTTRHTNTNRSNEFPVKTSIPNETTKTEIFDPHASESSSHHSRNEKSEQSEHEDFDDGHNDDDDDDDDDEESRGNVSELTEDRTFRSDTFSGISPTKQKPQSPTKAKSSLKEDTDEQEDHQHAKDTTGHAQTNSDQLSPPVDVIRQPKQTPSQSQPTTTATTPRNRRSDRDPVHRPPLSVEKNHNSRPTRTFSRDRPYSTSYSSSSPRIIHNIPMDTSTSERHHTAHNDSGSIAMSSIHSNTSYTSTGTGKLSVAQRARMEADQSQSKSKILKAPAHIVESLQIETVTSAISTGSGSEHVVSGNPGNPPPSPSTGSVWSRIGSKLVDTIDNSVLAVHVEGEPKKDEHLDQNSYSEDEEGDSGDGTSEEEEEEEEERRPLVSHVNNRRLKPVMQQQQQQHPPAPPMGKNLTLAQRQQIQREKQLAFLKQQGLLREE